MTVLDLSDNKITALEAGLIERALSSADHLTKLILSGNQLNAATITTLCEGIVEVKAAPSLSALDLSRTSIFVAPDGKSAMSEVGALAKIITLGGRVKSLNVANSGLGDRTAAKFLAMLGMPNPPGPLNLTTLDFSGHLDSRSALGSAFAGALPTALESLPQLTTCSLAHNQLGSADGKEIVKALLVHPSLRSLDLTGTNLCDVSPRFKSSTATKWSHAALGAIAEALLTTSITEIILDSNELCGMWTEYIGGEPAVRGGYTSSGVELLIKAISKAEVPLSIKNGGLKLEKGNFLRTADAERLVAAFATNSEKVEVVADEPEDEMLAVAEKSFKRRSSRSSGETGAEAEEKSFISEEEKARRASKEGGGELAEAAVTPAAGVLEGVAKDGAGGAAGAEAAAASLAEGVAEGVAEGAEGAPEVEAGGLGSTPRSRDKPGADSPLTPGTDSDAANKLAAKLAGKLAPKSERTGKAADAFKAAAAKGKKAASERKGGDDGKGKDPEESARGDGKGKSSGYGGSGYGQAKKVKKKVEKVIVEEKVSPFAQSPLMIAQATLAVRTGPAHDTPLVPPGKILPGSLVRIGATEQLSTKEKLMTKPVIETRAHIELDGDQEPLGWVTCVTRDEIETLKLAARGFPLMMAVKNLPVRETQDGDSQKIGEVHKDSSVRVMETVTTDEGVEKALVSRDGAVAVALGWINMILPGKQKGEADCNSLVPTPLLEIKFDLRVHTATSLMKVLKQKTSGVVKEIGTKKKNDDGGLPFEVAGKRPKFGDQDGPTVSRHKLVDTPATSKMVFNCYNAAFAVTHWTGKEHPFDKIPLEQSFDLLLKNNRKLKMGRLKMAYQLTTPFLERVEFPNEWFIAEDYDLSNDGWQASASLELEIVWGKEVATLTVQPWLGYSVSIGARLMIRKLGTPSGQCATVQRVLQDDRIVARVDSFSKDDGVKGEVIIDLQPANVILTTFPHYKRDQRLMLLHDKKLVDASVLNWVGGTQYEEGSRHMISVKPPEAKTGMQVFSDLNQFNHVAVPDDYNCKLYEEQRIKYCLWVCAHEDKVEDAITGNRLLIKDQLIFLAMANVQGGLAPPQYAAMHDVPDLAKEQREPSPKRNEGTHVAQPVLVRAGPGTGKTWMIKQALFLLAEALGDEATAGDGVRLVPVIVFVQRIVRLLREHGDDPSELLKDPNGLLRWYISAEFNEMHEDRKMLLLAHELRACVVLVDGVDEAAGMRDIVEAFVHYELVPSGNRVMVTSRPEGVDIEDYKTRFVVVNLKELSQEQQRTVIQMQLKGNKFFEHLVNISECRKALDANYKEAFRNESMRLDIEDARFGAAELAKFDERVSEALKAAEDALAAREADDGENERKAYDKMTAQEQAEENEFHMKQRWAKLRDQVRTDRIALAKPVQRKLMVDSQQELQSLLETVEAEAPKELRHNFLQSLNKRMFTPSKVKLPGADGQLRAIGVLDLLEMEIKAVPSPCTRAHVMTPVEHCSKAMPKGIIDSVMQEILMKLACQRKLPASGGKRGARAVPITAPGLWHQVVMHSEDLYIAFDAFTPDLLTMLRTTAANANLTSRKFAPADFEYRNPVDIWIESTSMSSRDAHEHTDSSEALPAHSATITLTFSEGQQCVDFLLQLMAGCELEAGKRLLTFNMLDLINRFAAKSYHPTHRRSCEALMLLSIEEKGMPLGSVPVLVIIEHSGLNEKYASDPNFVGAYAWFWERMLGMTQPFFDLKFEILLNFLVEAIGVPVLLSLLLLTYSASNGAKEGNEFVLDLNELPDTRLQLYKLGISAGIYNRMFLETNSRQGKEKQEQEKAEKQAAEAAKEEGGGRTKQKRKGTLEDAMGSAYASSGSAAGGKEGGETEAKAKASKVKESDGPVMDLNSILRGKKVRVITGEEEVADCYALCVRVLSKSKTPGFDMRTGIVAVVPKSHPMHMIVTALVEYVLMPPPMNESQLNATAKGMVRRVAVDNQENGRREFTSKDVACCLGTHPDELGLWSRLELDDDHGIALVATLAKQTDKAPAQFQFKHLSFQEGLYAEYLLMTVTSLAPPNGPGWPGWANDASASKFLNNRYMNNTCRIASGYLGGLLALQRKVWDFREHPLTDNGRSALWFVMDTNPEIEQLVVAQNEVGYDDVPGMARMLGTCPKLQMLDLSQNDMHKLVEYHSSWHRLCDAFSSNRTLTDLCLNSNRLGMKGIAMASNALQNLRSLKRLGLSYNEPGVEPALAELLRKHPALESIELVEALDRHFPTRAKDEVGRSLLENKMGTLSFLHCDMFVLSEGTTHLTWPKEASTSDAVLIAGALRANKVLTSFNLAPGATLDSKARAEIGQALLNNPHSAVAYCNDFGLAPNVEVVEFDLSRTELKDPEPFRLLAGCLKGNKTLTHVKLNSLRMEVLSTLAQALRGNSKLQKLEIISAMRGGGQSIVTLPVPELTGSNENPLKKVDLSKTCDNGQLSRVTCGMIGELVGSNTTLETLDLTGTGVGVAIGLEGEGGHILFRPLCQGNECRVSEVVLDNVGMNDKAGGKLLSALVEGLGKGDHGYEKITSFSVASNDLGKQFTSALKQLLWSERAPCMIRSLDLSNNPSLDGYEMAVSLKRNDSLTSLDFRGVPSANTNEIHSFIGSYLLQDNCTCRLGFLSCDAFQVTPGQTELIYSQPDDGKEMNPSGKVDPVILLLAGVVKFNSTLKSLTLSSGLNNEGAESLKESLKENQTLETLDVSGRHAVDATGVENICSAIRTHPKLMNVKIEGTSSLPIAQLRGVEGAEPVLNMAHQNLGELSAHAMGTLLHGNLLLGSLNLDHNLFGASGIRAITEGLDEAPIKSLHIKSAGLQNAENDEVRMLMLSICSHLGQLTELRMDENDFSCDVDALAPMCKLRSLRTLSMEKNRLTRMPSLIGTMLSLRHLLLYSNQLVELPACLCLITGLEVLDVHKNMITALPSIIGKLEHLKKLDVSENKITELPISICELSEDVGLSVGRNPLEKPAVEQARQGIGVIRRFFGWSKKDAAAGDAPEQVAQAGGEVMIAGGKTSKRPEQDAVRDGTPSRHNWAGPGSVILLFNCQTCPFTLAEGSDPSGLLGEQDDLPLTSTFNMQVIGRFRAPKSGNETFADRVEFDNAWLPWNSQSWKPGDPASLHVTVKGRGRAAASLLVIPWLSYGCSIGARLKTSTGFATVVSIGDDDLVEVAHDAIHNKLSGKKLDAADKAALLLLKSSNEHIDPRPDTVSRTSSPAYKAGQTLILVHEKRLSEAVVEHWFGPRMGSRHRVRLGDKGSKKAGAKGKKGAAKGGEAVVLDLNEQNHAKLVVSSVGKYESSRSQLLDALVAEYAIVYDAAIDLYIKAADQRLYLREKHAVEEAKDAGADEPKAEVEAPAAASRPASPAMVRMGASPAMLRPVAAAAADKTAESDVVSALSAEPGNEGVNALTLLDELIVPSSGDGVGTPSQLFVRTRTKAEHDLLQAQALFSLANSLNTELAALGAKSERRQVPVALNLATLASIMNDEAKRTNARDMILRSFESSYPKRADFGMMGDVLRQAIELRALVIVTDVRSEADAAVLKSEAVLEELLANRVLIIIDEEVVSHADLPNSVLERCTLLEVATWGCFLNDARLNAHGTKQIVSQMRPAPHGPPSHYERVSVLHLSNAQIGKDTQMELMELLKSKACALRMLDVSGTTMDGAALAVALKSNSSLRSLDVRCVEGISDSFESIGDMLLLPDSKSRLAYLRCDAFEVLEGEANLKLAERSLTRGDMRLLTGLLKNNNDVHELDLTATSVQKDVTIALMETITKSTTTSIATVHLMFNGIEPDVQKSILSLIEQATPHVKNLKLGVYF